MTDNHGENPNNNPNLTFSPNPPQPNPAASNSYRYSASSSPQSAHPEPKKAFDLCTRLIGFADVIALIFVILAGVSVLYNLLAGIVSSFSVFASFSFFSYFSTGIFHAAVYIFFAVLVSAVSKKIKK